MIRSGRGKRGSNRYLAAAMIVAVVAALGGCTTNNFNCNVKDACRPVTGPSAGIAVEHPEV